MVVTAALAVLLYCGTEAANVARVLVYIQGRIAEILGSEAISILKILGLEQQQSNHAKVSWKSYSTNVESCGD